MEILIGVHRVQEVHAFIWGQGGAVLSVAEFNFSDGVQRIHELLPSTNNQTLPVDSWDHNSQVPYLYPVNVNICAKFHSFHSYLNWMKEAQHIFVEGFLFIVLSNWLPATVPFVLSTDPEQRQWHRSLLCVASGIPQLASPTIILQPLILLLFRSIHAFYQ